MTRREMMLGSVAATVPAAHAIAGLGKMIVRRVVLSIVNVPETKWWWSDDVYGQPEHQREKHFLFELETDQGLIGLAEEIRGAHRKRPGRRPRLGGTGHSQSEPGRSARPASGRVRDGCSRSARPGAWRPRVAVAGRKAGTYRDLRHRVYRLQDAAAHGRASPVGLGTRVPCLQDEVHHHGGHPGEAHPLHRGPGRGDTQSSPGDARPPRHPMASRGGLGCPGTGAPAERP